MSPVDALLTTLTTAAMGLSALIRTEPLKPLWGGEKAWLPRLLRVAEVEEPLCVPLALYQVRVTLALWSVRFCTPTPLVQV